MAAPMIAALAQDGQPIPAICFWVTGALSAFLGNAPNFIIKAVAENRGVTMPSFFGYFGIACLLLLPLFGLVALVYF